MIAKKRLRESRLSSHDQSKELRFLLRILKKFKTRIDTVKFAMLEREPGKVFVGLASEKYRAGYGSEIITEDELLFLRRKHDKKNFFEIKQSNRG
jgi:hypothetical protein